MSINDSKINDENSFSVEDESYKSVNDSGSGIGGTTTASETLDRVGTAASEFNDPGARISPLDARAGNALNDVVGLDDAEMNDDSPIKWIVPLVILALLIILGYTFCGKSSTVAMTTGASASKMSVKI